jgi:hypothetical protein
MQRTLRSRWKLRAALLVAAAAWIVSTGAVAGADPSPSPSASPHVPTCAERYPEQGPAGIDLRMACVVRELVGHYTGSEPVGPERISEYAVPMLAIVAVGLGLFYVARMVVRRSSRVGAPVMPTEWWLCSACTSINPAGKPTCYSCHAAWTPDAKVVPTSEQPVMVQRFGGDRKKGGDRPGRGPDDAPL